MAKSKEKAITTNGETMTRTLAVTLTDAEIGIKARRREELEAEKDELEAEMKTAIEGWKEKLKKKDEEIESLRAIVRTGIEQRAIVCRAERDPEHGRIVFIRPDTGAVVDFRPMTTEERQLTITDRALVEEASKVPPAPPMPNAPPPELGPSKLVERAVDAVSAGWSQAEADMPKTEGDELTEEERQAFEEEQRAAESVADTAVDSPADLPPPPPEGDLPPPPADEEVETSAPAANPFGVECVDVDGGTWLVPEGIAENLRDANLHVAVCYFEAPAGGGEKRQVELSHIKGEPVQIIAKSFDANAERIEKTIDLMPSEVRAMRTARYDSKDGQRPDGFEVKRGGKSWEFVRLATEPAPAPPKPKKTAEKKEAKKGGKKA
jgi:hypothetical protein